MQNICRFTSPACRLTRPTKHPDVIPVNQEFFASYIALVNHEFT